MSRLIADVNKRGKFIVLYAPNNLGKTTQMRLLIQKLVEEKNNLLSIKYPIYNLKPTGPLIDKILRNGAGKNMTELEVQTIYVKNRLDFQQQLIDLLNSGVHVIAEDYKGTGMAWGMTNGLTINQVEKINRGIVEPDLAILIDGKRFAMAKENGHRYEDAGQDLWTKNRKVHKFLAKRYGWKMVNGNKGIDEVAASIWKRVRSVFRA